MDLPNEKRNDIITLYSQPAKRDMFVKGKMKAKLAVASDCEDTSFYIMVGINTHRGDYALRHDITSISYQHKNYVKNEKTFLDFQFDEYAFALKKGQRLRIDIAPTDKGTYVCHTNIKGDYSTIDSVRVANNKVFLEQSFLTLPVEKTEEI